MTINVVTKAPDGAKKAVLASEVAAVIASINKSASTGVVLRGADVPHIERIPTGIFEVDMALGGGFPIGRINIIYGPEGSGKSNLCACVAANAQKFPIECNKVIWFDLEGTMDPSWMAKFGIDLAQLIVIRPATGEDCSDYVDAFCRASDTALIVIDSIAVLSSTKEIDQSAQNFDVGTASLLVKRMVNKLCWAFSAENGRGHRPTVLFVNQTRFKIGVIMGDPETMPGGQAMKFNSSLTLRLYGTGKVDQKHHPTLPVFRNTVAVVKKSKVPIRAVKFEYDFCVVPHGHLGVGDTDSWNLIKARLQADGVLAGKTGAYTLFGKTYPILEPMRDLYYSDNAFKLKCQAKVLAAIKDVIVTVQAEGAAL